MITEEVDGLLARLPRAAAPGGPCPDEAILLALQGERLGEAARQRVDRHLAACRDCRTLLYDLAEPPSEALVQAATQATLEALRPPRGALIPLGPRRALAAAGAAIALAASLALAFVGPRAAPLPAYEVMELSGGMERLRSDPSERSLVFGRESVLGLVVRPEEDVQGELPAVAVYASGPEGALEARVVTITRGETGAFRLEAPAAALFDGPSGPRKLYVVIGRDAERVRSLAGTPGAAGTATARMASELRWLEVDVRWELEE